MADAAEAMRFERAAALRDLLKTVEEVEERQKMASASGDDADIFSYHAEPPLVAANIFHLRHGKIVDRREMRKQLTTLITLLTKQAAVAEIEAA